MSTGHFGFFNQPVLAIESSCDETAAAVVSGLDIRSNVIASQIELHRRTGGIVPEVAARAHVQAILPVIDEALQSAGVGIEEIRGIAVCNRPGLVGSLSVGVTAAKTLAFIYEIPLVGVHHLEGHLLSPLVADPAVDFPHVCLLVSGGHTELVWLESIGKYRLLGETRDDAAGEAFDKCARLLGFPYPGGRALSESAREGNPKRYRLPQGLAGEDTCDFSFSGLKTAVLRLVETEGKALSVPDAASAIEESIVSILTRRTIEAAIAHKARAVTLAGGVAANGPLRKRLAKACEREGIIFVAAPLELCTDNAAMIGVAGCYRLGLARVDGVELECLAVAPLPGAPS